jgi:hypothetical protein
MHDIDRTQREFLGELAGEQGHETGHEVFEFQETGNQEGQWETESHEVMEGPFNEVQQMELASELLEIQTEAELDQFLGKLIKGATRAVGSFARSSVGKALGGALKGLAKTALPIAGKALGTAFGGPLGGMVGGKLGNLASGLFETELEGLSQEDREFEVAKQFVRLAGAAAQTAVRSPQTANPVAAAQAALTQAARTYAPGLLRQGVGLRGRQGGRWIRRGRTIVLLGV